MNSKVNRQTKARLIAFYLPQYYPIPENDKWWGKGFTEWANVAKAKPLFRGHYQPHLPADLGFYDLRVPEVRQAQADMAEDAGIEGFCYWHYWFGNGKRLLERPFNEVIESGKPDFPFCLAWANESWSGVWHGSPEKEIVRQSYPGSRDYQDHFNALVPAFRDKRYITVDGKILFLVYRPDKLPDQKMFLGCWRKLAKQSNLNGFYFVGFSDGQWHPYLEGFDAAVLHLPPRYLRQGGRTWTSQMFSSDSKIKKIISQFQHVAGPTTYSYERFTSSLESFYSLQQGRYLPSVVPNWDNTPRTGHNGVVMTGSTPDLFERHLSNVIGLSSHKPHEQRLVFLKSWNEWAEGNYLEPDQRFGDAYLGATKRAQT